MNPLLILVLSIGAFIIIVALIKKAVKLAIVVAVVVVLYTTFSSIIETGDLASIPDVLNDKIGEVQNSNFTNIFNRDTSVSDGETDVDDIDEGVEDTDEDDNKKFDLDEIFENGLISTYLNSILLILFKCVTEEV